MILSASDSNEMVLKSKHINRAIAFLEEVEKKMPSVFFGHGTSADADLTGRILQTVSAMGKKGIHLNQLMRTYVGYVGTPEDLLDTLRKLAAADYITFDKKEQMIYPKDL